MVEWIIARLGTVRREFLQQVLPRLSEEAVEEAFRGFRSRHRIYTAWAVIRTFLSQIAAGDACRSAVERGIQQEWIPSTASSATGGYCQARQELPERPLRRLALEAGRQLHEAAPGPWRWLGRRVRVIDGASGQLPDTPANQEMYPQPKAQKPGCGFPVMYFAALMSLATGAIEALATGREGKERAMFRKLWRYLRRGDLVLGDAGFGSYCEMALLLHRGVDVVFRARGKRKHFRGARPLGSGQWLVRWIRPEPLPSWAPEPLVPQMLTLRLIHFHTDRRGFRSKEILLVTTLLDARAYPKKEFVCLYARRWEMELRLRDIKTTMGLERLSCKSPEGCRKELWMGILLYNLIRAVMMEAAQQAQIALSRISFAGTLQRLTQFAYGRLIHQDPDSAYRLLLDHLIQDSLPHRPHRVEPRKLKHRAKNYRLLNRPRSIEQALLMGA